MSVRISVESLSGCAWNGCPSQRGIRNRDNDFFGFDWLIFEQFIGYTLTWLQNFIDNKLVLRVGESEVDMRLSPIIKMCLIIVFISYSFFWLDHLADVNGGCFSAYL
jgi:hypothetical protein